MTALTVSNVLLWVLVLVAGPVLWLTNRMSYGLLGLFGVGPMSRASQSRVHASLT